MALVLPREHPARALLGPREITCVAPREAARPLRVGIINLMPSAESYEAMLLEPLGRGSPLVEPVWLRLESHTYASSDAAHMAQHYRAFSSLESPLDGLILIGAPVEELPYERVRYFEELRALLCTARRTVPSTLGICWGGMALAYLLGIDKRAFASKLFGIYPLHASEGAAPVYGRACAQSRHAGLDDVQLACAVRDGAVRLLAGAPETGATIVESADHSFLIHLGHPEYTPARLHYEYQRDLALGRPYVAAPVAVRAGATPSPLPHGYTFFAAWLRQLDGARVRG